MKKTILILAVIALLLIAYVSMKSEKATIETVPVATESVVVESAVDENAPAPDFIEEAIIIDDTMPDENDIAPVDEEVIGAPTVEAPAVVEDVVVAQ